MSVITVVDKDTMTEQKEVRSDPAWVSSQFKVVKTLFMSNDPQASKHKGQGIVNGKARKLKEVYKSDLEDEPLIK